MTTATCNKTARWSERLCALLLAAALLLGLTPAAFADAGKLSVPPTERSCPAVSTTTAICRSEICLIRSSRKLCQPIKPAASIRVFQGKRLSSRFAAAAAMQENLHNTIDII